MEICIGVFGGGSKPILSSTPKINVKCLNKTYHIDGKPEGILEDIDFCARQGEFVSVIGASGCGKSTFLNILAGLEPHDSGLIEFDGISTDARLGKVGYMQQKDLLLPWRTVVDNAILGLQIMGVSRKRARVEALDLIHQFGLSGFENQYPHALSGGMRQRAAFLRTMLLNQSIILLDEPFGALDALTKLNKQEWLMDVCLNMNKTAVLVTHDIDEAILLSDRVYLLTSRPGRNALILDVELERPRNYGMVTGTTFSELKQQLMSPLWEQIGGG